MNNNTNENSWLDILSQDSMGLNLEEVRESVGIRDVLTTLYNTVNESTTEISGITTLVGEDGATRNVVSFSDLMTESQGTSNTGNTGGLSSFLNNLVEDNRSLDEVLSDVDFDIDDDFEEDEDDIDEEEDLDLPEAFRPQVRQEGNENGGEGVEQENTISLNQLFARQSRLADLDNQSVTTLSDIQETRQSSTYTRPDLTSITGDTRPIVEFGEDVVVARVSTSQSGVLEFGRENYDVFNHNMLNERNTELAIERQRMVEAHERKRDMVNGILDNLFGERYLDMYGFDKIGKTTDGLPYIKAVLSTRFSKLYDRRFRKAEEMRTNSRNVAVANKLQSVKGHIELTIKGERNGDLEAIVTDDEGNRIDYLESKLQWLKSKGFQPPVWVLYLKTQFEFEETITTMEQLKTLEFKAE